MQNVATVRVFFETARTAVFARRKKPAGVNWTPIVGGTGNKSFQSHLFLRGDVLKYGMDARAEAVRLFDMGFADKLVGRLLGIPTTPSGYGCMLTGRSEGRPCS